MSICTTKLAREEVSTLIQSIKQGVGGGVGCSLVLGQKMCRTIGTRKSVSEGTINCQSFSDTSDWGSGLNLPKGGAHFYISSYKEKENHNIPEFVCVFFNNNFFWFSVPNLDMIFEF